ncbi:MAG: hypothetical protein ACRDCA_26535 [Serratia sp. (in: enterobacteria)]|uniref:hypothetical protein n=1 Tax=Serratia sp. (in: enterobacteria) TaxID=616 RepID=UPI003F3968F1
MMITYATVELLALSIRDVGKISNFIGKRDWKPRFTSAHQRQAVEENHQQLE